MPVAVSCRAVPSANLALAGVTEREDSSALVTFKVVVAGFPAKVAVIVVEPVVSPVVAPAVGGAATGLFDEAQLVPTRDVRSSTTTVLPLVNSPVA